MKLQSIKIFYVLSFLLSLILFQVACKKDNNSGPAPQITQLRALSPAPNDSVLTEALPGETVVIQGSNLASAAQIYFNGFPASFNSALFSNTSLVVTIPAIAWDSIPDGKINTVEVVTPTGKASFTFTIVAPTPTITSVSNEMAKAGEQVIIHGDNFYGISKVTFPGGIDVTNFAVPDITQIILTVPAGITDGGPIQVTGKFGTSTSVLLFDDFKTGMLTTFDDGNYSWGSYSVTSNPDSFPNNTGSYAQIFVPNGINAGDFAWYDGIRSINTNGVTWVPADHLNDPISSYGLKFEMSLKLPWKNCSFYLVKDYSWTYLARFEPWKTAGTLNPDGWETFTVPLTDFKTNANGVDGTGSPASDLATLLGNGSGSLSVMLINNGSVAAPPFDGAFDNFRVVKIQ
jgi:hypothetical protein